MLSIKNKTQLLLSILFTVLLSFSSCKKNKSEQPEPNGNGNTPTGTFMLHLHTYIDETEVDLYNITYTTYEGRNVSLSMAQFYISNIQLVKLDGSTYDIPGKKILKVFETDTYLTGTVPVGNYKSIRFKVGLDSVTNSLNPSSSPDSLILNKPAMWFGTTTQPDGYVYMNVQGMIDTSASMSGTPVAFAYKIGTNANFKQVNMSDKNFSIVKDQAEYGHIIVDYYKLFTGVQLNLSSNLSVTSAAGNNSLIATKIAGNIPLMFRYE